MIVAKHTFTIINKREVPYIDYIRQGIKRAEVRVYSSSYRSIKANDIICFHNRKESIICQVSFLHTYPSFRAMLEEEGIESVLPQLKESSLSPNAKMSAGIKIYENFPNAYRVKKLGCIAIGIEYLQEYTIRTT